MTSPNPELSEILSQISIWLFGLLAVGSLLSVLARRPWTAWIARRNNPPEVVSSDLFRETNMVISAGWSLLFAGAALLAAAAPAWLNIAYGALLILLGRLSPRFGAWYAARRLRAMGMAAPEEWEV